MESLCKESQHDCIADELHSGLKTDPNTSRSLEDNANTCNLEEDNKVMLVQDVNETNISERASLNALEDCIPDHADNANTCSLEEDNKVMLVQDVNETNISEGASLNALEDCIPDHADNANTCSLEEDNKVMLVQDVNETNISEGASLNALEDCIPDHADNAQIGILEGDKIAHSNDNADSDGDVEILDETINQNSLFEIEYDFKHIPYQITGSWKEFNSVKRNNYTRGCKWAPDGSCILTNSDDNILRIFNLPHQLWDSSQWQDISEMEAVVKIPEGEIIYDYSWYPLMNSTDPATCCLASASKNSTVHLWDGFTGELRCSYRTYNHMDEIVTPHSLSFDADGQKLFCGFEKVVRIFNVDTPGRDFEERYIFAQRIGQSGIVSCFAFTAANRNISAVGSYHKTIGIYSEPSGNVECILEGQKGGITQLCFSPDGTCLYSGGRKDPEILCWDLRNLGSVLFSLRRSCPTNQRMYFDISRCGKYIFSGNQNGVISVWDVTKEPKVIDEDEFSVLEPIQFFMAHNDCVNGISLHPSLPLLCSTSGQRKFPSLLSDDDDDGIFSPKIDNCDNSLRLWWLGNS